MSLPTEPRLNGPAPATGDLVNRVQQLRLGDQFGATKTGGGGSWLPWVLCGLLALSWAGVGIRWYRAAAGERTDDATASAKPAGGSADHVAPGEILLQLKGNLIPSLQIAVSPIDVAGEVTEITFAEGKRVRKGELLARLRDTRYFNEFNTAKASYDAAVQKKLDLLPEAVREAEKVESKAQWAEAEANRVQADKELTRVRSQLRAGGGSALDLEKAEANLRIAEARAERTDKTYRLLLAGARKEKVQAADADVAAAKARLDEAKRLLDNCTILAPIDGTVLTKKADIGSLVSPAAFNVSVSLCEIADLSSLEVEIDVPERQIGKIRPNLDCRIAADADPERVYRGRLDRVMPIADDSKNVIKVRIQVVLPPGEEPGAFLKPKMSVTVNVYHHDLALDTK